MNPAIIKNNVTGGSLKVSLIVYNVVKENTFLLFEKQSLAVDLIKKPEFN